MLRFAWFVVRAALLALIGLGSAGTIRAQPIPVKVAVLVTFEIGQDTGDKPGEFQFWAEREKWTKTIMVPGVDHPVYVNDNGVIAVVTGTTVRAGNQIMALVLSGQFDFSKTYWLLNGIAGVNPNVASLGSAAWARYVIDGDIAYELDPRDGLAGWPYGLMPIGSTAPNQPSGHEGWEPTTMAFALNPALVDWAYALTKDTPIPDSEKMKEFRAHYTGFPNAQKPPFVLIGDSMGSCRYWGGQVMTQWAIDWTKLWTGGKGNFTMTAMEEQGVAAALLRLSAMGRVDFQRFLVLRTGSDYCMPPPGADANALLHTEYAGGGAALEAAYRVGSRVVHALLAGWPRYATTTPTP
jgi:purine nucleoside permease